MTAGEIFNRAATLGLQLKPDGDQLLVFGDRCPADFADALRQHKRELLDLLETRTISLTPDCVPWLHVARQILAGEFDGADRSTVESLIIGLRSIPHPSCRAALAQLEPQTKKQP